MIEQMKLKRFFNASALLMVMAGLIVGCAGAAPKATENPAELYQKGEFLRAAEIWERQANTGDASAQFNLSTIYQSGRGVDPDIVLSRQWLNEAARNNYAPALHNLALIEIEKNQYKKALSLLEKAAEQDFTASLYTLGKFHQEGVIGEVRPDLAVYYVEKAAKSGLDKAQYNLGKMYRDGVGVKQDEKKSFFWFLKAAEQGSLKAQLKVAQRYARGLGVEKDPVQALAWVYLTEKTDADSLSHLKSNLVKILTKAEINSAKSSALLLETNILD